MKRKKKGHHFQIGKIYTFWVELVIHINVSSDHFHIQSDWLNLCYTNWKSYAFHLLLWSWMSCAQVTGTCETREERRKGNLGIEHCDCLVYVLQIRVSCSSELLKDRLSMRGVYGKQVYMNFLFLFQIRQSCSWTLIWSSVKKLSLTSMSTFFRDNIAFVIH